MSRITRSSTKLLDLIPNKLLFLAKFRWGAEIEYNGIKLSNNDLKLKPKKYINKTDPVYKKGTLTLTTEEDKSETDFFDLEFQTGIHDNDDFKNFDEDHKNMSQILLCIYSAIYQHDLTNSTRKSLTHDKIEWGFSHFDDCKGIIDLKTQLPFENFYVNRRYSPYTNGKPQLTISIDISEFPLLYGKYCDYGFSYLSRVLPEYVGKTDKEIEDSLRELDMLSLRKIGFILYTFNITSRIDIFMDLQQEYINDNKHIFTDAIKHNPSFRSFSISALSYEKAMKDNSLRTAIEDLTAWKEENYIKSMFPLKPRTELFNLYTKFDPDLKAKIKSVAVPAKPVRILYEPNPYNTIKYIKAFQGLEENNFLKYYNTLIYGCGDICEFESKHNDPYQVTIELRNFQKSYNSYVKKDGLDVKKQLYSIDNFYKYTKEIISNIYNYLRPPVRTPVRSPVRTPIIRSPAKPAKKSKNKFKSKKTKSLKKSKSKKSLKKTKSKKSVKKTKSKSKKTKSKKSLKK